MVDYLRALALPILGKGPCTKHMAAIGHSVVTPVLTCLQHLKIQQQSAVSTSNPWLTAVSNMCHTFCRTQDKQDNCQLLIRLVA